MIGKVSVFLCLIGLSFAGNLYGGSLGYSLGSVGYGLAPAYSSYSSPIVRTIAPISYASPVSYAAPISYASYAPVSYGYSRLGGSYPW